MKTLSDNGMNNQYFIIDNKGLDVFYSPAVCRQAPSARQNRLCNFLPLYKGDNQSIRRVILHLKTKSLNPNPITKRD